MTNRHVPLIIDPPSSSFLIVAQHLKSQLALRHIIFAQPRRDKSLAKALLAATRIAAASMNKAAAATRIDAERCVKKAAFAKKKAREALERLVSLLVSKEKGEDKNDLSRRPIRLSENANKKGFRLGMSF
ncbi:hypothetical protein CJ030_MR1G008490 [Morella rubra]|uniref:Uncharacterized protein n=1 Tax=Morella rubra TaxID=262757 RepID=A0A6A1WN36_9ROSI|nr:hypothetical protein CJ030_MR1G008490 [Morella rubra]